MPVTPRFGRFDEVITIIEPMSVCFICFEALVWGVDMMWGGGMHWI